jgi:hypothetical protein
MDAPPDAPACPLPRRRRGLRSAERVELVLIALAAPVAWLATGGLAWSLPLGKLVAYSAVVLLGQGLVRDLAKLAARRLAGAPAPATQRLLCLCAESSAGLALVAAGIGLMLLGIDRPVVLDQARLTLGGLLLLAAGFVAKDYVLVLRRVEDHATIAL